MSSPTRPTLAAMLVLWACAPPDTPGPDIDDTPRPQPSARCPASGAVGRTLTGPISVGASTDVAALDGVTRVDGDLDLGPAYDGSPLPDVVVVTGSIHLHDNDVVTALSLLPCLQQVGRDLRIENLPALATLVGAADLRSVGRDLRIVQTPQLVDLHGLDSLALVGRDLSIQVAPSLTSVAGLERLEHVGGDLTLASLWSLRDLRGLSGLRWIERDLVLDDLDRVDDLDGLQGVPRLHTLQVRGNGSLTSLSGLDGLLAANDLAITGNAALRTLDGLGSLATVHVGVDVVNNAALTDVSALLGIEALPALHIEGNPRICGEHLRPLADAFGWANDNQVGSTCTEPSAGEIVRAHGVSDVLTNVNVARSITATVVPVDTAPVLDTRWRVVGGAEEAVTLTPVAQGEVTFTAAQSGRFELSFESLDVCGRRGRSMWVLVTVP